MPVEVPVGARTVQYLSHPSGGDIYSADSRCDIELQWRSWKINSMQISICLILSRLPHAVSLLSPWGSALLLLHNFWTAVEFYLLFGWSVQWHCSVWCYRLWLQIWQIGDRQRFTENSRTLSLFPLSWPHFMCCGPKKCIKSFFSRMTWVLGLNVIRSVLLTNSELIALQLVLVVVCLRVKAFQVECLCVRAVRLNFMGIEFECQQIRY